MTGLDWTSSWEFRHSITFGKGTPRVEGTEIPSKVFPSQDMLFFPVTCKSLSLSRTPSLITIKSPTSASIITITSAWTSTFLMSPLANSGAVNGDRIHLIEPALEQSSPATTPLLVQPTVVIDELNSFRISLKWCALDHSSCSGKFVSFCVFIFLAVLCPIATALVVKYPSGEDSSDGPVSFNNLVQVPESALALIGFFTLARFFSMYGLSQLLFQDGLRGDSSYVQQGYKRELGRAFRHLAWILLPSFVVELAHKIVFFSKVTVSPPFVTSSSATAAIAAKTVLAVMVLSSWVYRNGVFLLVCVLFRLTCELQILRFEGFRKMFEGMDSDESGIFKEHVRIRTQLSVTSHRYRFFIIGCLVIITISQFVALLAVLSSTETKTFFNSGDLVVCSAVQLSGFCLCLLGAAKITHRAQGISAIATRWHLILSSSTFSSAPHRGVEEQAAVNDNESESDSDQLLISVDPTSDQDPSSFRTRQALVAYLEHNGGGITVYGFALDRGMLHTLFAFEFSLVLWILSKVVVLS